MQAITYSAGAITIFAMRIIPYFMISEMSGAIIIVIFIDIFVKFDIFYYF